MGFRCLFGVFWRENIVEVVFYKTTLGYIGVLRVQGEVLVLNRRFCGAFLMAKSSDDWVFTLFYVFSIRILMIFLVLFFNNLLKYLTILVFTLKFEEK